MTGIEGVSVLTKTYVTLGLVVMAMFEFLTGMYLFGQKGKRSHLKGALRLHRIGGYVFLVYLLWPIFVGLDLMGRLSNEGTGWTMDARVFYHAFLGVLVLLLLLLKIGFVRFWTVYKQHASRLGIAITIATIVTWVIAGLFWLSMMSSPVIE